MLDGIKFWHWAIGILSIWLLLLIRRFYIDRAQNNNIDSAQTTSLIDAQSDYDKALENQKNKEEHIAAKAHRKGLIKGMLWATIVFFCILFIGRFLLNAF